MNVVLCDLKSPILSDLPLVKNGYGYSVFNSALRYHEMIFVLPCRKTRLEDTSNFCNVIIQCIEAGSVETLSGILTR